MRAPIESSKIVRYERECSLQKSQRQIQLDCDTESQRVLIFDVPYSCSERISLEISSLAGYVICSILVLKYNCNERTFRQALSFSKENGYISVAASRTGSSVEDDRGPSASTSGTTTSRQTRPYRCYRSQNWKVCSTINAISFSIISLMRSLHILESCTIINKLRIDESRKPWTLTNYL